jgi:hypothetical protein
VESLLGEVEVWSRQTRVVVRNAITFDSTVGSPSIFNKIFQRPFFRADVESVLGEAEVWSF